MKKVKNIIKIASAVAVFGMGVSSCSLDMLPLNDVVLENFWTNKSDVESVVNSCYAAMQEKNYLTNTIVWGEVRSDNIAAGNDIPATLSSLMKGSLKTTNPYCDWEAMYNVINRCNTVLHYAPLNEDPNYTPSDLQVTIAEVKALRAISYLTLIKTFKDVPFSLEPSIDDNMDYMLPQTKFEDILDALIADIEETKDFAPRKYSEKIFNTAKITRAAMYSILAELYLWRASDYKLSPADQNMYYRKCIECCDWVINFKVEQYDANNIQGEDLTKKIDTEVLTTYGYPLLSETSVANGGSGAGGSAFNEIFGSGNSFESIFEITYHYGSSTKINEDLGYMYGGYNERNEFKQYVTANQNLMTNYPTGSTYNNVDLFPVNTDFRSILPFRYSENALFDIQKYSCARVSTTYTGSGNIKTYTTLPEQSFRQNKQMYPNWIVYRLPEIMLFRAEAEIEIAANMTEMAEAEEKPETDEPSAGASKTRTHVQNGSELTTAADLYDDAFNLISAVYLRSNPAAKTTASAKPERSQFKNHGDFVDLLMNERQREFLFEGKRYFDLVRVSRREGNTNLFVRKLISKFGDGGAAIAIKMKQMDFLYMPVAKKQMQVNPNLVQNSAYLDEEEILNN